LCCNDIQERITQTECSPAAGAPNSAGQAASRCRGHRARRTTTPDASMRQGWLPLCRRRTARAIHVLVRPDWRAERSAVCSCGSGRRGEAVCGNHGAYRCGIDRDLGHQPRALGPGGASLSGGRSRQHGSGGPCGKHAEGGNHERSQETR